MNLKPQASPETFAYGSLDRIASVSNREKTGTLRFYKGGELTSEAEANTVLRYLRESGGLLTLSHGNKLGLAASDPQHSTTLCNEGSPMHMRAYTPYGFDKTTALLGFCGQRRELFSGFYLLGNGYRAYSPRTMRFGSPDSFSPFGKGSINAYAYCGGDPINRSDPTGHFDWIHGVSLGFAAVGIMATLLSAGTAAPAFSALGNTLTGVSIASGSVTAASVVAALSVTTGTFAGLTQVAAITMGAMANGDASQIKTSRIIGLVGGTLGMMSTVSGLAAGKMAIIAEQRVGKELSSLLRQSLAGTPRTSLYPELRGSLVPSQSAASSVRTVLGQEFLIAHQAPQAANASPRVSWAVKRVAPRRRTISEPAQATAESVRRVAKPFSQPDSRGKAKPV